MGRSFATISKKIPQFALVVRGLVQNCSVAETFGWVSILGAAATDRGVLLVRVRHEGAARRPKLPETPKLLEVVTPFWHKGANASHMLKNIAAASPPARTKRSGAIAK